MFIEIGKYIDYAEFREILWSPVAGPQRCLPIARKGSPCKDSTAFKFKSSTAKEEVKTLERIVKLLTKLASYREVIVLR